MSTEPPVEPPTSPNPPPTPPRQEPIARLRSVPYKRGFVWAEIFAFFNFCAAVAVITALPLFVLRMDEGNIKVLVGCIVLYIVTGIVSFLKRRHVICPLCKGTPLVSTRAHVHAKATRIFPLDYGTSTMVTLLFTQTFRCMYCGAHFDLLKPRIDHRKPLPEPAAQDNLP